jgi:hypothetical protein
MTPSPANLDKVRQIVIRNLRLLLTISLLTTTIPTTAQPPDPPHRLGPKGLSGWILSQDLPDHGILPTTLVIAHKGHIVRRIPGNPFIWRWMFTSDGKNVALESGPLHSGMECLLIDIRSDKTVADIDCSHGTPDNPPAWLIDLQNRTPDQDGH